MRYRLRTLLIVLAVGPMVLAGASSAAWQIAIELLSPPLRTDCFSCDLITPRIHIQDEDEAKLGIELEQ